MLPPVQISFRDIPHSDFVESAIWDRVSLLDRAFPGKKISSCQVVISAPHRHRHHGKVFHVQVRLSVPQKKIVVTREPEKDPSHENVYVAIRDAFAAIERQLEDYVRRGI